jgi:DNA-binding SARP family transcriptional activator/tetratricopeptide (TPR) repeat protein
MESRRYLRCLGQPALFAANGEPIRFRTKKHLALLVFLAVESRRAHRRDRLAELLWPDVPVAEARHSLATALSILRPRLGAESLETTREHVTLSAGRVALDLDRLLARDVLGEETSGPLEVAGFLDGFEIPGAREFALWKDRQQARLLPAIKDALVVLIDRCRRTGATRQIEQLADRMLALDELSEEAVRAKMEARAFAGDRLTALKIFEEWREKLAEELGAAPSDLVEGMAVRLRRRGWERTTLTEIPTVPTDQWRGRPFVGRTTEYRVLYEAWEAMRKGVAAHPLVLGDSGIGKTTLVERLTTAAGLEGAAISRVQCYDLEREIPYATVGTLIHGLLDRPGVSGTPPESLAELARTVPEVRRRFPAIPPPVDSQGETARILLTESFHDMLTAISEDHPVILVVDDLHLADDASLAVLHLVMRRAENQPIMMIMIARPGELHRSPQASRIRDNGRSIGLRELEVEPLSPEESRDLLRSIIATDETQPGPSVSRTLIRASAGFPMILELLVQDWQSHGPQSLALAVDAMTSDLGDDGAPPMIYRESLERIVRSIDPATHGVLNVAAILGRRLNDIHLYRLVDLSTGQTMSGMAELVNRRVLRDGGFGLEFVNELVRTAAYLGVPAPLRKLLHSGIADRFIRDHEQGKEELELVIAWHCMRAGRTSEATPYLLRGAREAIRSGAPHAAENALASALANLVGDAHSEASLLLAQSLQEQGRWRESLDLLSAVGNMASGTHRQKAFVYDVLARLNLGHASSLNLGERVPELAHIIRTSTDSAVKAGAGCALAYAVADLDGRDFDESVVRLLDLVFEDDLDPEAAGRLALAKGCLLFQRGDYDSGYQITAAAFEDLQRKGAANLTMAELQGGLGSIRMRQGKYEEAVIHYQEALRLANRLGNDTRISRIAGNLAVCLGRLGRYGEQLQIASKAPPPSGPDFAGFCEIQLAYSIASAHAMRQRYDLAVQALTSLDARLVGPIPEWIRQAWSLWKADVLNVSKRRGDALECAREAIERNAFKLLSASFAGPFARWVALTSVADETSDSGRRILKELLHRLPAYDAIDQAEILSAAVYLDSREGCCSGVNLSSLESRLSTLPPAVRSHLSALGTTTAPSSS